MRTDRSHGIVDRGTLGIVTGPSHLEVIRGDAHTPLKEGDVLFQIDPRPFQYSLDQLQAELVLSG